jgi:hypothetical protein
MHCSILVFVWIEIGKSTPSSRDFPVLIRKLLGGARIDIVPMLAMQFISVLIPPLEFVNVDCDGGDLRLCER